MMNNPQIKSLNPEQLAAVRQIEGPMMVLAGPGTGKTQIIAMRIAHILETTQMDPQNILCLTFTQSGVVAMRERLLQIIGTAAYYVRIHTFHSFCDEVIMDFPEKFVFASKLEALTDVERIQFMQQILDKQPSDSPLKPFAAPYLYQRDCRSAIQDLKRENCSPADLKEILKEIEEMLATHTETIEAFLSIHGSKIKEPQIAALAEKLRGTHLEPVFQNPDIKKKDIKAAYERIKTQLPKQQALADIYQQYQDELCKRGRYDFEDMIIFAVEKFKTDPDLLAHYQEQFQYILVDEYQDTNGAQNSVIELIGEFFENPNIFVVGDDKQSIFRFQGASLENILYFYRRYQKHINIVSLKQNYRSQQTILDAAHSLIQNNNHSLAELMPETNQELNSATELPAAKLKIAKLNSPQLEHYFLAKSVQELIQNGTSPQEIAILYRNNRDVHDIADLFVRLNVPFHIQTGEDVLKDPNIHKLIKLLKLIQDPTDENLLFQVLRFDFLGHKTLDVFKLTVERKSIFEAIHDHPAFKDFAKKLLEWNRNSENSSLTEFFDTVLNESGFKDAMLAKPDKLKHLNNLNTFFDQLKSLNRANHSLSLANFLEHIELLKENDLSLEAEELQANKNAVCLMTAHKSKGLEFEYVFIMKCTDKNWGNKRASNRLILPPGILKNDISQDVQAKNEDERRLFFVAMTRAKTQAIFTYAATNENHRPQVPSIFLQELDPATAMQVDTSKIEEEALERLQTVLQKAPTPDYDQEEREFIKGLLKEYKMSVTHLNNYLLCPRMFFYRSLLHVPSAKNKNMSFGTAIHDALKEFSLEHKKGQLPTEDFLQQSFQKALNRQVMTQLDRRGSLEFGLKTLSDYYSEYSQQLNPNSLPEYNFSSHGVNLDGIQLTGQLDKVEILDPDKKTVHVVDYKTGNPDSKSKDLGPDGKYRRQILFYKLLCDLSPKFTYQMVSGEIDFVQRGSRTGQFKKQIYQINQNDLEELKITIKDVYKDIMDLKFLNPDEFATCGECEYCLSTQ